MSSDLVLVCKEFDNGCNGSRMETMDTNKHDKSKDAIFIDEASMGTPWTEFGCWFAGNYNTSPTLLMVLEGTYPEHLFTRPVTEEDHDEIQMAISKMEIAPGLEVERLLDFFKNNVGKHISTENW